MQTVRLKEAFVLGWLGSGADRLCADFDKMGGIV